MSWFPAVLPRGGTAFAEYMASSREWRARHATTARRVALVTRASRSVEEVVLQGRLGGEQEEHGSAVVAEWDEVGVATYACGPHGRIAHERRYRVHESCPRTETRRG